MTLFYFRVNFTYYNKFFIFQFYFVNLSVGHCDLICGMNQELTES